MKTFLVLLTSSFWLLQPVIKYPVYETLCLFMLCIFSDSVNILFWDIFKRAREICQQRNKFLEATVKHPRGRFGKFQYFIKVLFMTEIIELKNRRVFIK